MPSLLCVNNYFYRRGGAEVVFLEHGAMFKDAGWQVDWFSMKHPRNPLHTNDQYFADLIDLEYMPGAAAKMRAAASVIYNRNAARQLERLIVASRPDIAHLHNIYHHLSPSILGVLRKNQIPVVLTAHDLKLACPNYKMLSQGAVCERCKGGKVWNVAIHQCMKGNRALSGLIAIESALHKGLRLYASQIDRIVAPSRFYQRKLIEWGWPESQVVYIPNFVRSTWQMEPPQLGGALLYFGRLSEEKGIATLIRASARAGVKVVIAGTGPNEVEFRTLAKEIDAPVEFAGFRAGADLEALVNAACAIVLPSEWYENSPMSVLEAYAAGRPVIGAAIGGIPELIRENETGWTFPAGDVDALAARMSYVMSMSQQTLSACGSAANAFVKMQFSETAYRSRMESLYASLLSAPDPSNIAPIGKYLV